MTIQVNEWMGGWMDGWMSERTNKWLYKWMNDYTNEWISEWMDGWMDEWMKHSFMLSGIATRVETILCQRLSILIWYKCLFAQSSLQRKPVYN